MVLLCLLGITFFIGSRRRAFPAEGDHEADPSPLPPPPVANEASNNSIITTGTLTAIISSVSEGLAPQASPPPPPPRRPHPAALKRRDSSVRRIIQNGAGNSADDEQVVEGSRIGAVLVSAPSNVRDQMLPPLLRSFRHPPFVILLQVHVN